jgi:hypothetical protein
MSEHDREKIETWPVPAFQTAPTKSRFLPSKLTSFPFLPSKMPFPSFPTYEAFLAGFGESLSTDDYVATYPEYYEECEDANTNDKYIAHFLKGGLDPQTGLEMMLDCLITHPRYAGEAYDFAIDPFLAAGASLTPLTPRLLHIPNITSMCEFEDAIFTNAVELCSAIMDHYWTQMDHAYVQQIADWSVVVPKYWEYITGDVEPRAAFLSAYKCFSDYLRGDHTRYASETKRRMAKQKFMQRMMGEGMSAEIDEEDV